MKAIRRHFWDKYHNEIIVSFLGIVGAIVSAVMDGGLTFNQVIIIVITLSTDAIILSNKSLLDQYREYLKEDVEILQSFNELSRLCASLPDKWKKIAADRINKVRNDLREMSNGKMILTGNSLVVYQAQLLKNANKRVYAIHQALDEKSLKRWDRRQTTKDFTEILIKANKRIKVNVEKKRIFILDADLLEKKEIKKLWNKIIWEQRVRMFFRVKVITKQSCEENNRNIPGDMLICDDEVVAVHFYDENAQGEIFTNEKFEEELENFGNYWEWAQKPFY